MFVWSLHSAHIPDHMRTDKFVQGDYSRAQHYLGQEQITGDSYSLFHEKIVIKIIGAMHI